MQQNFSGPQSTVKVGGSRSVGSATAASEGAWPPARRNEWPPALAHRPTRPARPASRFLSSHTFRRVCLAGRR